MYTHYLQKNLIYYDSDCYTCDRFIMFVLKNDKEYFNITSLNSTESFKNANSIIVFTEQRKILKKSKAIAYILSKTNVLGKLIALIINVFPPTISDTLYDLYSKYRSKIGNMNSCDINNYSLFKKRFINI